MSAGLDGPDMDSPAFLARMCTQFEEPKLHAILTQCKLPADGLGRIVRKACRSMRHADAVATTVHMFTLVKWIVTLEPSTSDVGFEDHTVLGHVVITYKNFSCAGEIEHAGNKDFEQDADHRAARWVNFVLAHAMGLIAYVMRLLEWSLLTLSARVISQHGGADIRRTLWDEAYGMQLVPILSSFFPSINDGNANMKSSEP